jgi:hypothetical protein
VRASSDEASTSHASDAVSARYPVAEAVVPQVRLAMNSAGLSLEPIVVSSVAVNAGAVVEVVEEVVGGESVVDVDDVAPGCWRLPQAAATIVSPATSAVSLFFMLF